MIAIPRSAMGALGCALAAYVVAFGASALHRGPVMVLDVGLLVLFSAVFAVSVLVRDRDGGLPLVLARAQVAVSAVLLVVGSASFDAQRDSYSSGAWEVAGVACLAVVLLVRRRRGHAWTALGLLILLTVLWAGPYGLIRFGVFAMVLLIGAVEAGARAVAAAEADIAEFGDAERGALEWRAAQEAHHFQREVRLRETSRVGADMLHRIIEQEGRLDAADRFECRVLEQTIRDEIRGRRLLNDAVRRAVIAARRRGAFVQLLDDGGVDDLDPAALEPVLDRIAEAVASVSSDRIIVRTAPADSARAATVVGLSTDPIAAALGLDDEDEQVDLFLELDRPGAVVP